MTLLQRTLVWAAAGLTLAGTFALYTRPHFLVDLADRVWSCF